MDVVLLVVQYQQRHVLSQGLTVLIYSIKLKFEFAILGKLVSIAQRSASRQDDFDSSGSSGQAPQTTSKERACHVEPEFITSAYSSSSFPDGTPSPPPLARVQTFEEHRRRRTIALDEYADACRAVARPATAVERVEEQT